MHVYVRRDANGRIQAASTEPVGPGWEEMPGDAPELGLFAESLTSGQNALAVSDLQLVRVLEDVIDLLIERSVIRFTDLPQPAQTKLLERRSVRASMRQLDLLDDHGEVI
jgi:hypothetical protein